MGSIFGKAKKGFGKALKPRGPGVIRPKPTDRYGQQMKPKAIRPGKKDGGRARRFGSEDGVITPYEEKRGRAIAKATGNEYKKGGKVSKKIKIRNTMSKKMFNKAKGKKDN